MEKDDIRHRLFNVISAHNALGNDKPIASWEKWQYKPDSPEQRKHPRKDVSVYGIFETESSQFRALTKNVSLDGVLIDSETYLPFNEHIDMTFIHRKFDTPVRTNGKVVRVDANGVGVKFNEVIPVMSLL